MKACGNGTWYSAAGKSVATPRMAKLALCFLLMLSGSPAYPGSPVNSAETRDAAHSAVRARVSARPSQYRVRARPGGELLERRVAQRRGGSGRRGTRSGGGRKGTMPAGGRWQTGVVKKDYVGKLSGKSIPFPGVKTRKITYTKRDPAERDRLRKEFDESIKQKFLKGISGDPARKKLLERAGIPPDQIDAMAAGKVPIDYQVHHRVPLDGGGTNDLDNLMLVKQNPYHLALSNAQRELTSGMVPGEKRVIEFPIPDSFLYPLPSP